MALVLDNNLALASVTATTYPPRLGVNTLFRASEGTVTVSAEDTANDGHKENAYKEGFTHDFWRPGSSGDHWLAVSLTSSAKANYIGLAAHDLHQVGGSFKAQYSTDGGTSWNDAHTAITPANSQPVMVLFTEVEAADWRLWITSTSAAAIGAVHIGAVLESVSPLQGPWDPPHLNPKERTIPERSESGAHIGLTIINDGIVTFTLDFSGLDMGWLRDVWKPLRASLIQYPFFFTARDLPATGNREQEVVYAWVQQARRARSGYDNNVHGSLRLPCEGIII